MQTLQENSILDIISPQVLSVLQFRALCGRLLPHLKTFELWAARGDSIPFIPLFLSPRTSTITFAFNDRNPPKAVAASMIIALPVLCPDLRRIGLHNIPADPTIIASVSDFLLTTNHNALQYFCADCPLSEEARRVFFKLPNLRELQTIFNGPTTIPTIVLPNLTEIDIGYDHGHEWLQGFHGASFRKLETVRFHSHSESIGDFLGAFERVALTTSIPATLTTFRFHTFEQWRPNIRSLLPFTQLRTLVIEFSCELSCSSTIDDDSITDLARAMPMLEALRLGKRPCQIPAGVTSKGLSALAHYCLHLSELCIHFQVDSLDPTGFPISTPAGEPAIPRGDCALTDLDVGDIHIPEESTLMAALVLLRIFPRLKWLEYTDEGWDKVANAIALSKDLTDYSSKKHTFAASRRTLMTLPQGLELCFRAAMKVLPDLSGFIPTFTHFCIPHVTHIPLPFHWMKRDSMMIVYWSTNDW